MTIPFDSPPAAKYLYQAEVYVGHSNRDEKAWQAAGSTHKTEREAKEYADRYASPSRVIAYRAHAHYAFSEGRRRVRSGKLDKRT